MTSASIGVIGAGIMGRGIAQVAAVAGFQVCLFDIDGKAVDDAADFIARMINRSAEKGKLTDGEAAEAIGRVGRAGALSALRGCDMVVEAIAEKIELKQSLFKELEGIVGEDCILATNTSSLSVSEIAAACARPGRVAGLHFFNPVPLMKLVEVVAAVQTAPDVTEKLRALTQDFGKVPVVVEDSPGFLVNHAGRGFVTEALRVMSEQIADAATIDKILRDGVGFRLGPFELLDVTALDVSHPVMEQIYHQFYEEPRYRPQPITQRRLAAGKLGRKAGEGFYRYQDGKKIDQPARMPGGDAGRIASVYLAGPSGDAAKLLGQELKAANVTLARGAKNADICVVLPFGEDCTHAALAAKLPPEKTVAIDPCPGFDGTPIYASIAVIMGNPATDPALIDDFGALLNRDERPCVVIGDSPGFVAQRVLAHIVNIACDIAQQAIATPQDIETAVTLGLGYPKGPLTIGDLIGARRCAEVLDALYTFYGDPRYRLSPWLKRRAALGLSLRHG